MARYKDKELQRMYDAMLAAAANKTSELYYQDLGSGARPGDPRRGAGRPGRFLGRLLGQLHLHRTEALGSRDPRHLLGRLLHGRPGLRSYLCGLRDVLNSCMLKLITLPFRILLDTWEVVKINRAGARFMASHDGHFMQEAQPIEPRVQKPGK
jgi:hypothetical protein